MKGKTGMIPEAKFALVIFVLIVLLIAAWMSIAPTYRVYKLEKLGEAQLKQAEWNRQIQIKEAEANLESQKLNAQAEVERAKGVADSNKIIGDSLRNNDAYLRYLWINGLQDGSSEVIYIPTEANLPLLEARDNRF